MKRGTAPPTLTLPRKGGGESGQEEEWGGGDAGGVEA